ncbi:histidine kinase [Siphonobacter sp. SORGH_AS_0500]|uniref:sensor histidine kinase n=1 Tax=Siphonobacter sp. SORGH_AS_0500 TaxID=1864824 RepID=UPI0028669618|nr:histidine kinase [Siphonobacter sp. SORGH_AS_0500]MDR6197625.1 two-component system LytT family sensor kinase [Siphonobacter sp. SORGH_AS_0500]
MKLLSSYKTNRAAWAQGIFWLSYFLFEWLNTGAYLDNFRQSLFFILLNIPLLLAAGYWHLLVTIRHFLLSGKMLGFYVSLVAGILVFGSLRRFINYTYYYPAFIPMGLHKPLWYFPKIMAEAMQLHLVVGLFIAVDLVRHALQQQRLNETYRREKVSAEYRLLQSQVQPHFLFNTLNNLISVSMHQPGQVPYLLHRLAGLLSYQLHESHRTLVPITRELAYLTDYISLEKIRYGDRLDVQTNFQECELWTHLHIPPLLLLPFVENAFKHGASQTEEGCWIQLHVSQRGNRLVFSAENSVPEVVNETSTTGLGLNNLKQRLEILFPGTYELVTLQEEGQYLAVLKFDLY